MKKQTYRLRRRHGQWAAGDEIELTEEQAQALDNEAPGVLERIIPETLVREMSRTQGEGHVANQLAPKIKPEKEDG